MSNVRYLVVTNDKEEHILFDSKYIEAVAEFVHKPAEQVRSLISKHEHHYKNSYTNWRGAYKILRIKEED